LVIVSQDLVHKILTNLIRNKSDIHEQAFTETWKKNLLHFSLTINVYHQAKCSLVVFSQSSTNLNIEISVVQDSV